MRRVIRIAPGATRFEPGHTPLRIDPDALHAREVDYQPVVTCSKPWNTVPPASHCDGQTLIAREVDATDYIGYVRATHDQPRLPVDHGIVDLSRHVVMGIPLLDRSAS